MIGRQQLHQGKEKVHLKLRNVMPETVHSWGWRQFCAQSPSVTNMYIICTRFMFSNGLFFTYALTSSSSFCVSASIRRISSIVSSTHLSIQQKSWRWKLVKILFSCWGRQGRWYGWNQYHIINKSIIIIFTIWKMYVKLHLVFHWHKLLFTPQKFINSFCLQLQFACNHLKFVIQKHNKIISSWSITQH